MNKRPKGYFQNFLAIDVETSGISRIGFDPTYDPNSHNTFQTVSFGALVVDSDTLKIRDELYTEIQWNKISKWEPGAEKVHGLSKEYLKENGVTEEAAVLGLGEMILKYWAPKSPICLMGHNVMAFDRFFIDRMFKDQGINLKFSYRGIDTNTLGFTCFNAYTSDQLFDDLGLGTRGKHNAMEDIKMSLEVVRATRTVFNGLLQ